jgi:uncharacterized protein with GYD domain
MPTYFILETSTREGATTVRDAPRRSEGVVAAAERMGVKVIEWFYTIAPFDFLMKAEAPDDQTIAAFVIQINAGGNVAAKYYRAFTPEEWKSLVGRLP